MMGILKNTGTPLNIDGVERHLLFTLNAIDAIQERFDEPLESVITKLTDKKESGNALRAVLTILFNDEVERLSYKPSTQKTDLEPVDEKQMGWILNNQNMLEATYAVLRAYGYDLPEPDENDPNGESGQQKK